ncbi:MAG: hypothetical protein LBR23_08520 [Spirochaetaceae bacterium]|jgi:hypothetical protein|nr:hypothetical protein [Spirochaetaceae bacterium]
MDDRNGKKIISPTHSGLTSRGLFFLIALSLFIAGLVAGCDLYTMRDYLYDRSLIPVADITGIPSGAAVDIPLTLAPVIVPGDATNRAVSWAVSDAGDTGAVISGGVFTAAASGTAVITARVRMALGRGRTLSKVSRLM